MTGAKLAYKPFGLLLGAAAGMVAGAVFNRAWRALSGSEDVPRATDDRGWGRDHQAAAQGAVFAVVKAAADRAGAQGMRRMTGRWPR